MENFKPPVKAAEAAAGSPFTAIEKKLQYMRESTVADIRLMKDRVNSFTNSASSLIEQHGTFSSFINSTTTPFSLPAVVKSSPMAVEIEFYNKIKPRITELRRVYSSPDFVGRRRRSVVLKWPKVRVGVVKGRGEDEDEEREWSVELEKNLEGIKSGWKEFERMTNEKIKKAFHWDSQDTKQELPPLDLSGIFACIVKRSETFLDQLGVKKDVCDKMVENLCSKGKIHLLHQSFSGRESSAHETGDINDENDLRIASLFQSTGYHYEGGFWSDSGKMMPSDKKRHVAIVTTASLPWMTGTAVNPLFRAAYLAKSAQQNVTLLVPWLSKSDQELVYPNSLTFNSPEEQEAYIKNWLEDRIGFKTDFKISFYPGKFSKERRSIIPAGDTSQFIPSKDADIAILEEPEHLNWYHHGKRWTDKFNHVVGVVHTNYLEYIKREKNGAIQAFLVKHINNIVARAYCDKVLRLSAATQDLPKSVVCNVHGVNPKFLEIGEKLASQRASGQKAFSKGAYFLGKMVWAKGYRELIDLMSKHQKDLDGLKLDVFGNGEDAHEVQSIAKRLNLNLNFQKGRDHADDSLNGYKVFVNPSVSDVLCTATAEALAMGKFVVCADHPSNEFFSSFPNCLTYKTPEDFVARVKEALSTDPQPLTPEQRYKLSWEAATERFMEYSDLDKILNGDPEFTSRKTSMGKSISLPNLSDMVDGSLAFAHYCCTGSEILRLATGAIPGSRNYDKQHCKDLNLMPPQVENPIYGW